jgi:DNA-binding CsgD family transcriptional regulator
MRTKAGLTRREVEVLQAIADHPNLHQRDVARLLYIEFQTVKFHLMNVRQRLGCQTTLGCVLKGIKEGIIELR